MSIKAKIRYRSKEAWCIISKLDSRKENNDTGERVLVTFDKRQRAITPGQSVVFYKKDIVVGGGIIAPNNN